MEKIIEENKLPKLFRAKDLNYTVYQIGKQNYSVVLTALYKKYGEKYALTPTLKILEQYGDWDIYPNHVEKCFQKNTYATYMNQEDFHMDDDYEYVSSKITGASFKVFLRNDKFNVNFEIDGDKLLKPTGFVSLNQIQEYEKHANVSFQENFKIYLDEHKEKEKKKREVNAKTYDKYPTL